MSFIREFERRNVLRVGAAYVVVAWLLIQVAETIFPLFGFDGSPARIVVIVLAIGLIPTMIFAWAFELTPEGFKKEKDVDRSESISSHTGKKLDRMIMVVMALALGYFAFDKFVLGPERDRSESERVAQSAAQEAREQALLGQWGDRSVAVLPFINRSEEKQDEYFTDGMHDELLTRLARISELRVISRTSVMRYRGSEKSIPEIAAELSVSTILEGGVQRAGNQVRINVQLIDATTDEHLWAEIFDREMTAENLFAIQSDISGAIADALEAQLSSEEESRLYDLPTADLEAYNHFLRGRQLMATRETPDLEQALVEFEHATSIDPGFALAWVGVADTHHLLMERGKVDAAEHVEIHRQAAETAIGLNPGLGEAFTTLSFAYVDLREYDKALAAIQKAIELNPNYAQAYHWYANQLHGQDIREQRLSLLQKAAQLDPMSPIIQINLVGAYYQLARDTEARASLDHLLEFNPEFTTTYNVLGNFAKDKGQLAEAYGWYRQAHDLEPNDVGRLLEIAEVLIALGSFDEVDAIREQLVEIQGPAGLLVAALDWRRLVAQSRWEELEAIADALPVQWREHPGYQLVFMQTYLLVGEVQQAYQFLLNARPFIMQAEEWKAQFVDRGDIDCDYPGVLLAVSEEKLGVGLLEAFQASWEDNSSDPYREWAETIDRANCHLVGGELESALTELEAALASGLLVGQWSIVSKKPWWRALDGLPRYQALVADIESKMAEQRELLAQSNLKP